MRSVGGDVVRFELLDEAEQVVPTPAIETDGMVTQLVQNLFHLERGGDGLKEHGCADRATGHSQIVLGRTEHVIPKPCLEMRFQLWKVEVRSAPLSCQCVGIVEEVEGEIDDASRSRYAIHHDVSFIQMPSPGTHQQHRRRVVGLVQLAVLGVGVRDGPRNGIPQIDLPVHHVVPCRTRGILKVSHVRLGARIEAVDDHLAIDGACDFDTPVQQICGRRSTLPTGILRRIGFQKCWKDSCINLLGLRLAPLQQ
mmetsp:Transcript_8531/g.24578  ORF Transcript_8531/g.24578 Transcript_8531/m.24578 type:complete len:253 (-) Transcript_8531:111-869(-)